MWGHGSYSDGSFSDSTTIKEAKASGTLVLSGTGSGSRCKIGTQYYANGFELNASAITNDSPLLRDGSPGDNSSYYTNTGTSVPVAISAVWDLGSSGGKVGRIRFRYGSKDATQQFTFMYSDNGTSWTTAWTAPVGGAPGTNSCVFTWASEYNVTTIVTTSHRYWRLCVWDTAFIECADYDVRLGDFRIYDENDIAYCHQDVIVKTGNGFGQFQLLGVNQAVRVRLAAAYAQMVLQGVINANKSESARGFGTMQLIGNVTGVKEGRRQRVFLIT